MSRPSHRLRRLLAGPIVSALLALMLVPASPATGATSDDAGHRRLDRFLQSPVARWVSGPTAAALRALAGNAGGSPDGRTSRRSRTSSPAAGVPTGATGDVLVNDPAGDGIGDADMTTQSETTVAVSGIHVVVGYNDDGRSAPFLKAADDLSGYSWSEDDGTTWHDGSLPNHYPTINLGDPVLTSDRGGRFYYASLSLDPFEGSIGVVVGRSDDGGETFSTPRVVIQPPGFFESPNVVLVDKPWMAVGPDPADPANDMVYVVWTEFVFGKGLSTRIRISSSRDHGMTWSGPRTVASEPAFGRRRSVALVGSSIVVRAGTGMVFVAWERAADDDRGQPISRIEQFTRSGDSGHTFAPPIRAGIARAIGEISEICGEVLSFGAGRPVRVQEFPVLTLGPDRSVLMTYNTQGADGQSHVVVARSTDRGTTWSHQRLPTEKDAFMPSIGGNGTGVTVLFYRRSGRSTLEADGATSADGVHFTVQPVSSSTFGVPVLLPSYDPFIAPCYMGDYVAVRRVGSTSYAAWGDNRIDVVNGFWPDGRPDPNVFFAKL